MGIFRQKKKIEENKIVSRRGFDYSNRDIRLQFSLNVNDPTEMTIFKQLLEKAVKEVGEAIDNNEEVETINEPHSAFGNNGGAG